MIRMVTCGGSISSAYPARTETKRPIWLGLGERYKIRGAERIMNGLFRDYKMTTTPGQFPTATVSARKFVQLIACIGEPWER